MKGKKGVILSKTHEQFAPNAEMKMFELITGGFNGIARRTSNSKEFAVKLRGIKILPASAVNFPK